MEPGLGLGLEVELNVWEEGGGGIDPVGERGGYGTVTTGRPPGPKPALRGRFLRIAPLVFFPTGGVDKM